MDERSEAHPHGNLGSIAGLEGKLVPHRSRRRLAEQLLHPAPIRLDQVPAEMRADDLLQGPLEHLGKSLVAVVDMAVLH